jgi:hypothetical protein
MYYVIMDVPYVLGADPFSKTARKRLQKLFNKKWPKEKNFVRPAWDKNGFRPFITVWSEGPNYVGWLNYLITEDLERVAKSSEMSIDALKNHIVKL